MIRNEQERQVLSRKTGPSTGTIATVAAVYEDGIALILPGETSPGQKHYPYNSACSFSPGQRVHIAREGRTIIVEYPIGGMQ